MAGGGFEPSKAGPPDFQSGPFYPPGTPPAPGQTATGKRSDPRAARAGSAAVAWTQVLARVAETLRLGQRLELLQRVVLDLPDPLARDVERAPDLLERPRPSAGEPEAHLDDLALALRQGRQRAMDVLLAEVLRGDLERRLRRLVLDEVAELGLVLLADRLLERDRLLGHAQDVAHLARRALELVRDLLRRRLAAQRLHELALDVDDLVELLDHVDRDADRPALVGDRPRHGLADPPRGIRRELVAAAVVELLDRADQAQRPLLDEIEEREPAAQVALGDRDDEAQVGLDHLRLGDHVAALDALGELDLLLGGQQRHAPDRAQVQAQRVEARLDREVDLGFLRRLGPGLLARLGGGFDLVDLGRRGLAVGADDVDALLVQVLMQLPDLLLGDFDLL